MAYQGALSMAGGREVEILTRSDERTAMSIGLYSSLPYDLEVPGLPVSRLSITLTPSRVSGIVEGDRWRVHETRRRALFLTPANAAAHWCKASASRHMNIYFHADAFQSEELGRAASLSGGSPILNASLPGSRTLIDALAAELERPGKFSAEASDSLARLLLIRLARSRARRTTAAERMEFHDLRKLREYVMAHLAERILVADLAAVIGLSANRFAHVFSASTGRSPHQFVIGLRLEMAQDLLVQSQLGLAEIASTCGFSSQQHMTATMQRQVGTTPGQLRRLRASPLPERS
jgi:AraC family transcriptional regulator